jgi:hypothetical protein
MLLSKVGALLSGISYEAALQTLVKKQVPQAHFDLIFEVSQEIAW